MTRAVIRALSIFDVFDENNRELTLQEISERAGIAKATTFRLVNTLQKSGFLVRLESQRYCLSRQITKLAGLVRSPLRIREIAKSTMVEVNEQTGETVTLNEKVGFDRVCIEVVDTPSPLMTIVSPGEHVSLLFGATGRILLAYLDEEELKSIVRKAPADRKVDLESLQRELARFRQQGYAITRGQRVPGVTAIAVPLFNASESMKYSLALTGPSIRVDSRDSEFIEIMKAAGRQISLQLGAQASAGKALVEPDYPGTGRLRPAAPYSSSGKASARKNTSPRNRQSVIAKQGSHTGSHGPRSNDT